MSDADRALERAGRTVAALLGDGPGTAAVAAQREEIALAAGAVARRRRLARAIHWAALIAVVAGAAAVAVVLGRPSPMSFTVGGALNRGPEGAWLANREAIPLRLTFDDGSAVEIGARSSARVLSSSTREVRLLLETGLIDADVLSAGRTRWLIDAGPFRVNVTGTRFAVGWDPVAAALDVSVSRGAVVVEGVIGHSLGVTLPEGRRLRARDNAAQLMPIEEGAAPDEALRAGPSVPAPAPEPVTDFKEPSAVPKKHPAPAAKAVPEIGWLAAYAHGRYREALDAAEARGFHEILTTAGLGDLWALAESARYARNTQRSRPALMALRARFPDSGQARTAAFLLGRLAVEYDAEFRAGAGWFRAYLAELPDGPLAEEAAGRLIDALLKSGDGADAREAATAYLRRYPEGIFAELARSAAKD